MHQQAPAAGGQGRGPQCRYTPRLCHEREAVARTLLQLPSHLPYVGLQCCTSNGCSLFPISRELSRFHSREIGNEKVRESRAPGKLEPGNEFPTDEPLPVGNLNVEPVNSVCDLGVYLDTDMSTDTHITQLVCTCFGILRQIRCIRRSLSRSSRRPFCPRSTTVTSCCRACRNVTLSEYSLLSMLLLVLRLERANTTTSCRC